MIRLLSRAMVKGLMFRRISLDFVKPKRIAAHVNNKGGVSMGYNWISLLGKFETKGELTVLKVEK